MPDLEPKDRARIKYAEIRRRTDRRIHGDRIAFLQELARGRKVLDIGCVEHSLANESRPDWVHGRLREVAAEILGMDYESEEVEKMRARGFNVVAADATNFDLGESFDVIVAGETIEHLLNAEGFLKSLRRHLRPDGVIVLTMPNANSLNYFLQNMIFGHEVDGYDHSAFYTPMTAFNLLSKTGFRLKQLAFFIPDTSHHHRSPATRAVVRLARWLQWAVCWVRPSLCRQMAVVAELAP